MRTTVTLDDDVAAKLKADAYKRGVSFKEALNGNLRRGLDSAEAKPKPYRIKARPMGFKGALNLDKALQIAGRLEEDEIVRKLSLGK